MPDPIVVIGGGIAGAACATAFINSGLINPGLINTGVPVVAVDRGHRPGGRMASRTLRDTGTANDGRPVDIGASYFTVSDPDFAALVEQLTAAGVVRPWTDTFHVAGPQGIEGTKTGPMRFTAVNGLRSVVEHLWSIAPGVELRSAVAVEAVAANDGTLTVDGADASAVALCLPEPQARRIVQPSLLADLPDGPAWDAVIVLTAVFSARTWPRLDGVFVNDDPVLTWIADDGARRGDGAPVLVAHLHPALSARNLAEPAGVAPLAIAALRRTLGIADLPDWFDVHRWTYARPSGPRSGSCWQHGDLPFGLAGDAWCEGPKVESAWRSGRALGQQLAAQVS